MLPIDPRDGQGSVTPTQPFSIILPAPAMAHGGTTIIRPGAVAWGGLRGHRDQDGSSCEAIERSLGAVTRDAGQLPGLIDELTRTRLWVPLPAGRPFTDGSAVRLPLVSADGIDFVPCFTSVGRLAAWADADPAPGGLGRRAGDARIAGHIVVAAVGLARRLPPGLGLSLNPDSVPGVPLYPECVSYLARQPTAERLPGPRSAERLTAHLGLPPLTKPNVAPQPVCVVGHPPTEPAALLRAAAEALRSLPRVSHASRAWLSVPGQGEGLVISVILDDPGSGRDHAAVADALEHACASVPLHVPFPVDLTFPGESAPDAIDEWVSRNTRPFYVRC